MTTPNNDNDHCIPGIVVVDGAAGGSFQIQQDQGEQPKVNCAQCSLELNINAAKYTCPRCFFHLCTLCTAFGYGTTHQCKNSVRKEFNEVVYVCTCGRTAEIKECEKCLNKKIAKYNCFNPGCDDPPKQAKVVCRGCFRHFTCSNECYNFNMKLEHSHALWCRGNSPIPCKHGKPVIFSRCDCTVCKHGRWSEDCHQCIKDEHDAKQAGTGAAEGQPAAAEEGGAARGRPRRRTAKK
jgi:hypothetical protein